MNVSRLSNFIALLLLAAFFLPYIFKLTQIDITIVLVCGLGLAVYDFISGGTEK
jgi:hypothetical protein